ncbi:N-acyl homoserine lactonase family protein [Zavarzinia compransoris]|uniref:MBL fold metallo-hydrolase n=1 Tax=Zavarzinia compransoris TaxID=1264899 RepID=A0A317E0Q4_9PROT|nr:N-acyl homoserine lactonase family protein [Zavarzinia compransoris]PWR20657.1 MBL fold metallo-hydrolase [Zavarzinia compransoris]TDP44522.1 N-acyl homoserine lactone hydrolase [Zavarzinia compransoris]
MTATTVRKLYVFLVGYEVLPKSVSTLNRGADRILAEPVCAYLIETERGYVLFDAGLNRDLLTDDTLRQRYYPYPLWLAPSVVLPEHDLLPQLAKIGVSPRDIGDVILSHTHCDHAGNLKHFAHARVHIQRREYDYAMGDHGNYAVFNIDFDLPGLDWQLHDGDWQWAPGIEAISTPGHTPGHQSLVVSLPSGATKILVVDAGDLAENFAEEIAPGECLAGVETALASIRRIKALAAARVADIVLFHDADHVHALRLAPAFYD